MTMKTIDQTENRMGIICVIQSFTHIEPIGTSKLFIFEK